MVDNLIEPIQLNLCMDDSMVGLDWRWLWPSLVWVIFTAGCAPSDGESDEDPNQVCVEFVVTEFAIESPTRFSADVPDGTCVGAQLDSNENLYTGARVHGPDELPEGILVGQDAGISSLWLEHLEISFPVTNSSDHTYCSFSFESLHYLGADQQLIFSAGPIGIITELHEDFGGRPGYCLAPGMTGWARKVSVATIPIGPAERVTDVRLGKLTLLNYEPASDVVIEGQEIRITPISLTYDNRNLVLAVRNESDRAILWPAQVMAIYSDRAQRYLDFDVPAQDDVGANQVPVGGEFTLTFAVQENSAPRGRAWRVDYVFLPELVPE